MRHGKALLGLLMVGILLQTVAPQEFIHKARPALFDPNRKTKPVSAISIGPTPAMIAALGGFRTVAADLLWLQAERVWDGGSWWALLPLLDAVTQLDPHFILAWQVYGWHAAYNMHAESETVIDRRYWLARGANILEQAVEANPDNWEIRFELGWTLYDRAHEKKRAAEYFYQADQMPGAKSYVTRLYYRCYEGILDIKDLMPALEYAKKRHTDLAKSDDVQHQVIVNRDCEWWMKHKDDPLEHRRQIVIENTARAQRSVPFYLYPDDPYWDVCPICGLPSKKGSEVCGVCGAPLKAPSQRGPATRGEKKT
jgi:tetratricopeptide (TPR) repeat protein